MTDTLDLDELERLAKAIRADVEVQMYTRGGVVDWNAIVDALLATLAKAKMQEDRG